MWLVILVCNSCYDRHTFGVQHRWPWPAVKLLKTTRAQTSLWCLLLSFIIIVILQNKIRNTNIRSVKFYFVRISLFWFNGVYFSAKMIVLSDINFPVYRTGYKSRDFLPCHFAQLTLETFNRYCNGSLNPEGVKLKITFSIFNFLWMWFMISLTTIIAENG